MAREFARAFYQSQNWKRCRAAVVKERRGLCERCLAKGIYSPGVIVHHKIHISPENITDESVLLDKDNLELVCRECHADLHRGDGKRYTLDELGRVVLPPF